MNYYLDNDNFYNRLECYYKEYGKIILLFDFDDTIFPHVGDCDDVITLLKRWKNHAYLICYTARDNDQLGFVSNYLKEHDIPFDYINRDYKGKIPEAGQKIYGNIMLDDKCGLSLAYGALNKLINKIEMGKI